MAQQEGGSNKGLAVLVLVLLFSGIGAGGAATAGYFSRVEQFPHFPMAGVMLAIVCIIAAALTAGIGAEETKQ